MIRREFIKAGLSPFLAPIEADKSHIYLNFSELHDLSKKKPASWKRDHLLTFSRQESNNFLVEKSGKTVLEKYKMLTANKKAGSYFERIYNNRNYMKVHVNFIKKLAADLAFV